MIVLKRSWPAVSQICSFTRLPSRSMLRILKSILRAGRGLWGEWVVDAQRALPHAHP